MPEETEYQRVSARSNALFRQIRRNFVREAAYLKDEHQSLEELADYTRVREEVAAYPALEPEWLERLSLDLMDARHPAHRPLFEAFQRRVLEEDEDSCAPRPLYWGENRPEAADPAPRLHEAGLSYRCNVAVLDHAGDAPELIGNWVLSFAADIPEERPAPALEMNLNSLYLLSEWQGLGVGSAVNRMISELVCKILSEPLADKLPEDLPAPPAMQFDSEYISRDGQRLGRQICDSLAPLAQRHGLLFYDSARLKEQGGSRNMV